ncbi:histidine kinase [Streptomyces violarus]|uniref:histidine kinase n=1 Tax=Streptomyces violarus TaxID=67380 RepID=A0A7W4ZSZ5_9ACTN|nr:MULTISPECIES: sensor histidine kinase [Streptomyces]MBB3078012.1 signal transduction histidine kinase [Streptomyces violarus]WRT99822.1 sensor histidine kinase [Streptomyces sp. CGMCC 4.1772]GHD19296.1 histidine kinase [Streptomyces violarus]
MTTPRTVLEALTRSPLGFLRTAWPWRALGYLLSGGMFATGVYIAVGGLFGAPLGTIARVLCAGAVLVFAAALAGPLERRRLSLVDRGERPESPGGPRAVGYGVVSVLAVGWMDLGVVLVSLGIPGFLLLAPFQPTATPWQTVAGPVAGALLLPVAAYPVAAWAGVRAAVARAVLFPKDRELREVVRSRARLVDAFETERRRIERDLHDGAQQRLVALTMKLGLAGLDLPPGSAAAKEVGEAHALAKEALTELRELIRGIHPQILTERGLPAAARDIAGRCPVPTDLDLDLPGRLPATVEQTAYYVTAEALTNIARHSGADRCRITARCHGGVLRLDIEDNGSGAADPARGTGLVGLADRIAAADGRMLLSSPPGGPTLLRAEIPCGSPSA